MATSELFYAILALDSYNRGPDPSVVGLGGAGSTIGSMTILNIPVPAGSADAGFYAAAYQDASGNIVISYRGTDDPFNGDITAWTGGSGFQTMQAELAAKGTNQKNPVRAPKIS